MTTCVALGFFSVISVSCTCNNVIKNMLKYLLFHRTSTSKKVHWKTYLRIKLFKQSNGTSFKYKTKNIHISHQTQMYT